MTSEKLGKGELFLKEMVDDLDAFLDENRGTPLAIMIDYLNVDEGFKDFLLARSRIEDIKYHAAELEDEEVQKWLVECDREFGLTFLPIREGQMTVEEAIESMGGANYA